MFYTLLKIQRFFEGLYQSLISLLRILLRFRFSNALKQHRVSGGDLLILGNGPSLGDTLADRPNFTMGPDCMAVNQMVLTGDFEQWKPSSYVLLDIGFFKDATIPRVREITDQLIAAFLKKTTWPIRLFLPAEGRGSRLHREISAKQPLIKCVFFNRTNVEGLPFFTHWAYRRNLGMPKPQNVLVACLMIGICLGYDRLILVGADHSWLENIRIDENNRLISLEKHFYDPNNKGKPTPKEHPDTLQPLFLHDYLKDLSRTFSSYHDIRRFGEQQFVQILNGSKVSYIDAFDRLR